VLSFQSSHVQHSIISNQSISEISRIWRRKWMDNYCLTHPRPPHHKSTSLSLGLSELATHFAVCLTTREILCAFFEVDNNHDKPAKWHPDQQSRSCPPMALPRARPTLCQRFSFRQSAQISSSMSIRTFSEYKLRPTQHHIRDGDARENEGQRLIEVLNRTVHTGMAKNKRQPYAVSEKAGHQTSAESWGTG
jgi:hypothetical protein